MPEPILRANISTAVNAKKIRREKRDGRDYIVVPSATLPDDVVMNGILYPADEIAAGFPSLEKSPAPFGHPTVNGAFVSARDPRGINAAWVGAWNENVRQEKHGNGKRVLLDKVIDVEVAGQSPNGKRLLEAIANLEADAKAKPIHTSTGVYFRGETVNGQAAYNKIARSLVFDHDAILLDEAGAAKPEQGVGIMVNKARDQDGNEIDAVNSTLEDAERQLDWAVDDVVRAVDRIERASIFDEMKAAIKGAVLGVIKRETTANTRKDADMADEQLEKLSADVKGLAASLNTMGETLGASLAKSIGEAVTNALAPVTAHVDALTANQKAKDDAEKAELVDQVVKANLLDEATAKETALNVLRALAKNAPKPKGAIGLNSAGNGGDPKVSAFKVPAAKEA